MSSINDVAAAAGVSVATVSRVFSGKPHVRPEVRERVLAAAGRLEYQPSRIARSLRLQRSQVFGVIIPDIENPFFTALVRAVEDVAHQHEHAVFLCNTDEDVAKERLYVALMEAEQVAGVIVASTREEDSPCRWLVSAGIPVVAVDRRLTGLAVDTVLADNRRCARAIVTHLIDEGHTRIGAVVGPSPTTTGKERLQGYLDALDAAQMPHPDSTIRSGLPTEESGMRMALELLDGPHPPEAIFAGNNLLAAGVLAAARARSLSIPGDLRLAAFGETPWMRLVSPTVSTVRLPIYDMGATAAQLLIERMNTPGAPPREVVLPGQVMIRESSQFRSRPQIA